MSLSALPKLARYIPLWLKRIPEYPLYYKGNPQLRIHLPLFWMKLIKWNKSLPSDTVCFQVHHQMTELDVKNYLEKIYKVGVLTVRTTLLKGEKRKDPMFGFDIQPGPDRRIAFVQLRDDQVFQFPDIFEERDKNLKKQDMSNSTTVVENSRDVVYKEVPSWFKGY